MKKLFTLLNVFIVSLLLVSCGGGKDYRNMIPSDAFMVMSANPKAIAAKAQIGDFKQSPLWAHLEEAFAENDDISPETRDYLLSMIAEPSKTGLSMDHDFFMFVKGDNIQSQDFDGGLVFKVHDRKALDKATDLIAEENEMEKQEDGGIVFLFDKDSWMSQIIAYNDEAAILFFSPDGYEKTQPAVKNLFAQKKDVSIMCRPQIAAVLNSNNDMNTIMSYAGIMPMMRQMGMGSGFEWMGKMSVIMPINFEKGAVVSDSRVIFDDKDAEKQAMEVFSVVGKMSGDMLKYLPAGSVAAFGTSLDGAKAYEMLAKIPMYSMILAMAPQTQTIMDALNGEIMFSFNTMSENGMIPLATVIATIEDESVVATIRDLATMGGITLTENAPGDYQGLVEGVQFWFGLKDKMLYISTDPEAVGNIRNGGGATSLHDTYGNLFNDSYGSFAFDMDALGKMLMTIAGDNAGTQDMMMAMSVISLFKDFQLSSPTVTECKMVVNMTDRDANAAQTIYKAIEGFVLSMIGHSCNCC